MSILSGGELRRVVGPADVPCGSCHACCRHELVRLMPEDDASKYFHRTIETQFGSWQILQHKPNGDCIYLGPSGCTIHGSAPVMCRAFDCRRFYLSMSGGERKRLARSSAVSADILKAGRKRLGSLPQ